MNLKKSKQGKRENTMFSYSRTQSPRFSLLTLAVSLVCFTQGLQAQIPGSEAFENAISEKRLGNLNEAIKEFSKAIELNPRMWEAYSGRAIVRRDLEDFRASLSDLSEAIRIIHSTAQTPESHSYLYLGALYQGCAETKRKMGDYRGAIIDCSLALNAVQIHGVPPQRSRSHLVSGIHFENGLSNYRLDNSTNAILAFTAAIKLNPTKSDYYISRGFAYLAAAKAGADFSAQMKNLDLARSDADRAIEFDPESKTAHELIKRVDHYEQFLYNDPFPL